MVVSNMNADSSINLLPLAGIRVVEFSVFMAGPVAGLLLADLGAEVIKVERIPDGDDSRRMSPPAINGESAGFMILNRNKKGVAIDAKSEGGRDILHRLCASADVIVENFRPGALERLGFGYEAVRGYNPAVVYASISGYGLTGPMSQKPGLDLIAQAFSGLMGITGEGHGRPPVKVGAPVTDTTSGMLAALGVVSALFARQHTGKGRHVDVSLTDAGLAHTYWQTSMAFATGQDAQPLGSAHPLAAPYQAFRCADAWVIVGAPNESLYQKMLLAIDAQDLNKDERFGSNALRLKHRNELTEALSPVFLNMTREDCLSRLEGAGVPCGPVNSMTDVLSHPQTLAREMVVETTHPVAGRMKALGCPVKFKGEAAAKVTPAPMLGQHNGTVLASLGYSEAEIRRLQSDGAIGSSLATV
jgi:crotonobetainyl-CoA:carnitine CoA-transferase CaiB-like acyl-CoA transferase